MERFRQSIYTFMLKTGLIRVKQKYHPRYPITILGYHQVYTPSFLAETMGWQMTPEIFRRQIEYVARYHTIISSGDLEDIVNGSRRLPPNAMVLTFDDGYRDVYDVALPILQKLGLPATVFITTGSVDRQESIWSNKIYYYFYLTRKKEFQLTLPDRSQTVEKWETPAQRRLVILHVNQMLKRAPEKDLQPSIQALAEALDVPIEADPIGQLPMLTWDMVRSLRTSSVFSLGAHTVNHPILSRCDIEKQRFELEESRNRITKETGEECRYLAYPNGQKQDFTDQTQQLAREVGYALAFKFYPDVPGQKIDPMAVPRHPVMTPSLAEFAWRVS